MRIKNVSLPLQYVGPKQINALIPAKMNPDERHQLIVLRNGARSPGIDILVVNEQPAIFTAGQNGRGQGAILIANSSLLAEPVGNKGRPVDRGDYIQIYASGLGDVDTVPLDGAPAPSIRRRTPRRSLWFASTGSRRTSTSRAWLRGWSDCTR